MDSLDYKCSKSFLNADGEATTGLETSPPTTTDTTSGYDWSKVTDLFSKGLDLGINLTRPTGEAGSLPPPTPPEDDKIFGMPKIAVYGGVAIIGLIGVVIIVKKLKK